MANLNLAKKFKSSVMGWSSSWWLKSSLVSFLLVLFRFYPTLLGKTAIFGDNFYLMIPAKIFISDWLATGVFPLWNPHLFAGISLIGDINQSILYPSTVLFMVFQPATALNCTIIIHQFLAFLGVMYLARQFSKNWGLQLAAAGLWTFSPFVTASLNNISTAQSLSWLPWIVAISSNIVGQRKSHFYSILLVIVVALQMFGGYPQHVIYSLISGVLVSVWLWLQSEKETRLPLYSWLIAWVFVGFSSILITSVVWLPFLEVVSQSTRSLQSASQAAAGSVLPTDSIKLVLPTAFDNAQLGLKWGPSWSRPPMALWYIPWISIVAIALIIIKKRWNKTDAFFFALIFFPLLLSILTNWPSINPMQFIPILAMTRGVSTILMISSLFFSIWFVTLIERVQWESSRKWLVWLCFFGAASMFVFTFFLLSLDSFGSLWQTVDGLLKGALSTSAWHTMDRDRLVVLNILLLIAMQFFFLGCTLLFLRWKRFIAFGVLLSLETMIIAGGHFLFGPSDLYHISRFSDFQSISTKMNLEQYRILPRNYNAPYTDFGFYADSLVTRKPFTDSFVDEQELHSFAVLKHLRDGGTANWNVVMHVPSLIGYTTLLPADMNAIFNPSAEAGINNLPEIKPDHPELARWSTKYYLVDTWFDTAGLNVPGRLIATQGQWQLYELEGTLPRFRDENGQLFDYDSLREDPNTIHLTFQPSEIDRILVVADRYDPNWRAWVGSFELTVENDNGQRRIVIPAGATSLTLSYFPLRFYQGLIISLLTVVGLLVGGIYIQIQGRRSDTLL